MNTSYLFYDLETSGLNKCFDQVLQFAAIRTDLELNELEHHSILVKLNPDTIPSPEAIITNNLSILELQNKGIKEIDAIEKIHKLFNEPGTISIGYNTLGFDDEFLRFSFYRNLLTPYTHQYANHCGRIDLYQITVLYYLFKHELLLWPEKDNGISLKLESINEINNLNNGKSHDAMNDTETTLKLASIFFKDRKMWDYACSCFDKKADLKRIAELHASFDVSSQNYQEGILIDGSFGAKDNYQIPILNLGWHNHYKNQILLLRLDKENLTATNQDSISYNTYVYRKKAGEPGVLLPPYQRFIDNLGKDRIKIVENNKLWLKQNPDLLNAICDYHREYKYPEVPNLDIDASLYQFGFLSSYEESLCEKFHLQNLDGKIALIKEFRNDNLRNRAVRLLCRNYLESLPDHLTSEFNSYLSARTTPNEDSAPTDYRGRKRLTPKEALAKIAELRSTLSLNSNQIKLLGELSEYISNA